MEQAKVLELKKFANQIRQEAVRTIGGLGVGHVGGALSMCDVLAVLYGGMMNVDPKNPKKEDRDWLVVSKGHGGPAVYATLALRGYFPMEELMTLNRPGTNLPSHCDMNRTPGIDMTTGSLGQGASSAMGIATGNRVKGLDNYTYLIMGDGESEEGQIWEAALYAGHRKLSNMIAFVDYNKAQIDGTIEEVCNMGDIAAKYDAFGWHAQSVDGHDVGAIWEAIEAAKAVKDKPSMIVLNTIKGKGISVSEGKVSCHNMPMPAAVVEEALAELNAQLAELEQEEGAK